MSLPPFKNKRRHPDKATFAERPSLKVKCVLQDATKMIFKKLHSLHGNQKQF